LYSVSFVNGFTNVSQLMRHITLNLTLAVLLQRHEIL